MWTRFTQRAQRVVALAQAEAKSLGERYVSTEHLLLGLIREEDTVAAHVLRTLELEPQVIRAEIARQVTRGAKRPPGDMTLTPRSKRVIDLAYNEARQFGHNYIGTEHLLLGLIRERDGLAGRVLANLGADLEKARDAVEALPTEPVSEKEITASSDSLPRPPSVSTQLLLAQLKDIRQIRGVPAICLSCFGSICLFLEYLMSLFRHIGRNGNCASAVAVLLFLSLYHSQVRKRDRKKTYGVPR